MPNRASIIKHSRIKLLFEKHLFTDICSINCITNSYFFAINFYLEAHFRTNNKDYGYI